MAETKLYSRGRKPKVCAFLLILAAFVPAVWGQTNGGGVVSPFDLGGSAAALGMGGAVAAYTGSGDGFFENPAVLATVQEHEIMTFHAPLFLDTIYDSIGYIHPVGSSESFGLAVARLGVSSILQTQNNIQAVSTFSEEDLQGWLGYGFRLEDNLDLGGSVKFIHEEIGSYQGTGGGIDLGLLYHFSRTRKDFEQLGYKNFVIGFSVTNVLQPETKLFQSTNDAARVFRPALSYSYLFPGSSSSLLLTGEGQVPQAGGNMLIKAGLEFGLNKTLFARAGFDGVGPTAGAGVRFYDFEFDYAYNQKDLGSLNRFSLTYRFGRYIDPLQAQKIDLLKWVARSYSQNKDYGPAIKAWENVKREYPDDPEALQAIQTLQHQRKNEVQDQLRLARAAMSRGDYQRALPLIAKIMSLDPGNPEAKDLLRQVDRKTLVSTNYTRGVEAYSREDYGLAIQYLQSVYEVDAHYRDVNFLYHDAQSHYLPLESMPKELTELYAQGVNDYMSGDYKKAIEVWGQVLDKSPKNFLVRRNIEEAKSRMNDKAMPAPAAEENQGQKNKP